MKTIAYISALGTLVVFLGCNKNSDTGAGGSMDASTRSSSVASTDMSADTNTSATTRTPVPVSRDTSTSPDNTRENVRDRSDNMLTPGDQAENQQDLETTRKIRRAITSNDQLSQEAKNVKVMTVNGKVTLRGPVNSEEERKTIESIVQQMPGATVDNQLEVKAANQ